MILKQQEVIRHLLHKKGVEIDEKTLEQLIVKGCHNDGATNSSSGAVVIADNVSQKQEQNNAGCNTTSRLVVDSDTAARQKRLVQQNWSSIKSDPDFQAATDSDSAIMLEDHITEVQHNDVIDLHVICMVHAIKLHFG